MRPTRRSDVRSPRPSHTVCGRSPQSGSGLPSAKPARPRPSSSDRFARRWPVWIGWRGTGLVIAYEPVWAIGTGDAATGSDAQGVAAQIRGILRELDPAAADEIPIQYGGSVTDANAAEFFTQPDIDGALVGGASLKAEVFGAILRAASVASEA